MDAPWLLFFRMYKLAHFFRLFSPSRTRRGEADPKASVFFFPSRSTTSSSPRRRNPPPPPQLPFQTRHFFSIFPPPPPSGIFPPPEKEESVPSRRFFPLSCPLVFLSLNLKNALTLSLSSSRSRHGSPFPSLAMPPVFRSVTQASDFFLLSFP